MPILNFKVEADYQQAIELRKEIEALQTQLGSLSATAAANEIARLEKQLADAQGKFDALAKAAADAGADVEAQLSKIATQINGDYKVDIKVSASGVSEVEDKVKQVDAAAQKSTTSLRSAKNAADELSSSLGNKMAENAQKFVSGLQKTDDLKMYLDNIKLLFDEKGKTINQSYTSFVDTAHILQTEQQNITTMDGYITKLDAQREKLAGIQEPTQEQVERCEQLTQLLELLERERAERQKLVDLGHAYKDEYKEAYMQNIGLIGQLNAEQEKQLDNMKNLEMKINAAKTKTTDVSDLVKPMNRSDDEIISAVDALTSGFDKKTGLDGLATLQAGVHELWSEEQNAIGELTSYIGKLKYAYKEKEKIYKDTGADKQELDTIKERIELAEKEVKVRTEAMKKIGVVSRSLRDQYYEFQKIQRKGIENVQAQEVKAAAAPSAPSAPRPVGQPDPLADSATIDDFIGKNKLPQQIASDMRDVEEFKKQIIQAQKEIDEEMAKPHKDDKVLGEKITNLQKLKNQYTDTQQALNARLRIIATEDGSVQNLSAKLQVLQREYSTFNEEEKKSKVGQSIKAEMDKISSSLNEVSAKSKSFRTQMRALQMQLMQMRADGKAGTKEYMDLMDKAASMKLTMAGVNKELSILGTPNTTTGGIINGLQGISGAFSAAQGAMGLFADKNEDLAKTMVKVQSVMAITSGLQSLNSTLLKTSAFRVGILGRLTTWWKKCQLEAAAATELESVAEAENQVSKAGSTAATATETAAVEAQTVAVGGLAGAFKTLKVAVSKVSFGWWGLIITGALVALDYFVNKLHKTGEASTEFQKKLKDQYAEQAKSLVAYQKLQKQWANLTNEQQRIKFINAHKDALKDLNQSINNTNEAEAIFVRNSANVAAAFAARAKQKAAEALYEENAKKVIEAQGEQDRLKLDGDWTWSGLWNQIKTVLTPMQHDYYEDREGFMDELKERSLNGQSIKAASEAEAKAQKQLELYKKIAEEEEKKAALNAMKASTNGLTLSQLSSNTLKQMQQDMQKGLYGIKDLPTVFNSAVQKITPKQKDLAKQWDAIGKSTKSAAEKMDAYGQYAKKYGAVNPFTATAEDVETLCTQLDGLQKKYNFDYSKLDKLLPSIKAGRDGKLDASGLAQAMKDNNIAMTIEDSMKLGDLLLQLKQVKDESMTTVNFISSGLEGYLDRGVKSIDEFNKRIKTSTSKYINVAQSLWTEISEKLPQNTKGKNITETLKAINNSKLSAEEKQALREKLAAIQKLMKQLAPELKINTNSTLDDLKGAFKKYLNGGIDVSFNPKLSTQMDNLLTQFQNGYQVPLTFITAGLDGETLPTDTNGNVDTSAASAVEYMQEKAYQTAISKAPGQRTKDDMTAINNKKSDINEKLKDLDPGSPEAIKLRKQLQSIDRSLGTAGANYNLLNNSISRDEIMRNWDNSNKQRTQSATNQHNLAVIDLLKDAQKKQLLKLEEEKNQSDLAFKQEIKDRVEELLKHDKELWDNDEERKRINAENNGLAYSPKPWQRTKAKEDKYRREAENDKVIKQKKSDADDKYKRDKQELEESFATALKTAWVNYSKSYGNPEEKKQAIEEDTALKVAKAVKEYNSVDMLTAFGERTKSLKEAERQAHELQINWQEIFSDLTTKTNEQLVKARQTLTEELKSGKLTLEQYKTAANQIDAIDEQLITNKEGILEKLGWVNEYAKKVRVAKLKRDNAQDADDAAAQNIINADAKVKAKQSAYVMAFTNYNPDIKATDFKDKDGNQLDLSKASSEQLMDAAKTVLGGAGLADDELQTQLGVIAGLVEDIRDAREEQSDANKNKKETSENLESAKNSLSKVQDNIIDKAQGAASMFGVINSNVQELPGLLEKCGVDMDGTFGQAVQGVADTMGSVQNAFQDLMQLNFIGAASDMIDAVYSLGDVIFGGGNHEYQDLMEKYGDVISVWDSLISKKKEYISEHWGTEALAATEEALSLLETEKEVQQSIAEAKTREGASWRSHSVGYKMWVGKSDYGYNGQTWKNQASAISALTGTSFTGIADLASMTSEQLQKVKENYAGLWGRMDSDFRDALEQLIEYGDEYDDLLDQIKEKMTGFSFDSFRSSFISSLMDMSKDVDDFIDDMNTQFMQAAMDNILGELMADRLQDFYDEYYNAMADNNGLTSSEVAALRKQYTSIVQDAMSVRDTLAEITGYEETTTRTATSKGVQSITEDTANALEGRMTAIQIATEAIRAQNEGSAAQMQLLTDTSLQQLAVIQQQTGVYSGMEEKLADCTMTLHQIETNTAAIIVPINEMNTNINKIRKSTENL